MSLTKKFYSIMFTLFFLILSAILCGPGPAFSYPVRFTDSSGKDITINKRPARVVSLVPSITEVIFKLGAGDAVKAVTYHSTYPSETSSKEIIGGFFSPSLKRIEKIQPDIIFVSKLHKNVMERFGHGTCRVINLETESIAESFDNIFLLGRLFNREKDALAIVDQIKGQLGLISKKTSKIPKTKRMRVVRLMGRDPVMVPGDDSFQNEMIKAAGGIPPELGKKGSIVVITREEWMRFNPQVIYGCGGDRQTAKMFFDLPGWRDVEAVKNDRIFFFPCDLTCRAATNTGYFVSWLSARVYRDEFSKRENQVLEERVFKSRRIDIDLDYIKDARISYSAIHDFPNKTLIIDFKKPLSLVSTLEGERQGIKSVGNHYSSPPCWGIDHRAKLEKIRSRIYQVIGKSEDTAAFLFTGADMDNLAIKRERFKEMEIFAMVTAGVETNAVRMSRDEGRFYEPGTINIILLPNMKLTPRAMTRAIISATEAKTAALADMDIRSSQTPRIHQATGTGTDNIIVVEGTGVLIDNAGGHAKMGELTGKAVYEGVKEAIRKQNGLVAGRNIFRRLKERNISMYGLMSKIRDECDLGKSDFYGSVEGVLLDSNYGGFIESALSLSDDYENGLLKDLSAYRLWCKMIAEEIAGRKIEKMKELVGADDMPEVLRMALNAIVNGVYLRKE